MISKEEIKKWAHNEVRGDCDIEFLGDFSAHENTLVIGATWAQETIMAKSCEGFDDWFEHEWKDFYGKIGTFKTVQENCSEAWQAATLAAEKRNTEIIEKLESALIFMLTQIVGEDQL